MRLPVLAVCGVLTLAAALQSTNDTPTSLFEAQLALRACVSKGKS